MYLQPLGGHGIVVEWEINQKIAPTPSVILPLDESESSVSNIYSKKIISTIYCLSTVTFERGKKGE
jgi:hypothetical protein